MYLDYGHPNEGVTATWYMVWKSSAVGDLGTSLTALCVGLRYFKVHYQNLHKNMELTLSEQMQENSRLASEASFLDKYSYYAKAWMCILIYFCFWGFLISQSINSYLNLELQDKIMTVTLLCFTVAIAILSIQVFE